MFMKRGIILQIILLLFIIPSITAIEITLTKNNYQPQETLQAEITGNFISLTKDNIFIYKESKSHPEPVIKDLIKYNNKYYFYAILPNQEGNFTFKIQDTEYLERGKIKSESIVKNITLQYKNTSDLSINPGFVIPNNDFTIKVKSLYGNTDLTATFESTGETKQISLIEEIEEPLTFSLPELFPSKLNLKIKDYNIPVFILKNTNKTLTPLFGFAPSELTGTLVSGNNYYFKIALINLANRDLSNINLSTNLNLITTPNLINSLKKDERIFINLTIPIPKDTETILGEIIAQSKDIQIALPINLIIKIEKENKTSENKTDTQITDTTTDSTYDVKPLSCNDIGELCEDNTVCDGETIASLEGSCCIGSCVEEENSGYSFWIGIILIVLLILIVGFIFWKIKKRQKIKSPEQILKDRTKNFKQRMESNKEVSGGLDKV